MRSISYTIHTSSNTHDLPVPRNKQPLQTLTSVKKRHHLPRQNHATGKGTTTQKTSFKTNPFRPESNPPNHPATKTNHRRTTTQNYTPGHSTPSLASRSVIAIAQKRRRPRPPSIPSTSLGSLEVFLKFCVLQQLQEGESKTRHPFFLEKEERKLTSVGKSERRRQDEQSFSSEEKVRKRKALRKSRAKKNVELSDSMLCNETKYSH